MWDGEGEPVKVPEAKVRALLADLLVHEGRPVSADRLIDDLWGDAPPGNPANALQAKVSQLRRVLGRDRVVRRPPGYRLRLDAAAGDEVDADRFRALVEEARRAPDPASRAAALGEALALWRGPAYADLADAEFVRASVDRLAEQRIAVLEERAEARLAAGDHTLLTGELADLVARHPLRERLRAVQLRALYLAGRQSEALASYEGLRRRLSAELGVDPGPELTSLHEAILRQDPSLTQRTAGRGVAPDVGPDVGPATDLSADAAVRQGGSPLPTPLTALIGRDRAVADVGGLLGSARLVTLTGPGGVGKTRLALEAAARLAKSPDDVRLVELAALRGDSTLADLAVSVSTALGLRDDAPTGVPAAAPATPLDRLTTALRDRRTLLVLDNCEQVVEEAAALADALLRAAPGLRVLATSQEPLGLTGETVFLVEPLPAADAVQLFAARAAAAAPGFSLVPGSDDEAAVAEICRRLDGIPLALELAATRVRALGVRELADRLGDRFRLLTSGQRGAPARQQTLRAMIDWSWELLTAPERIVLRRLAVHRDGCTLDAAEAVCAGDGVTRDEVLDLVTRLVDRSLVVMAPGPAGTAPRYRLLESVSAYAMERLDALEDHVAVRERHLHHYLDLAERAEPRLRDDGQRVWLARLDAEAANLRAALDEATRRPSGGEAVRLATALTWWWLLRGRLTEARRALAAVSGATPGADPGAAPWAAPGAVPGTAPGTDHGADPWATPGTDHGATPGTAPEADPWATPGTDHGATPGTAPEADPWATPEADPGTTPGTAPEADPWATPEADPGTTPGTAPEADPWATPGTDPGTTPGTGHGATLGTAHGADFGATPGADPGTAPGAAPSTAPAAPPAGPQLATLHAAFRLLTGEHAQAQGQTTPHTPSAPPQHPRTLWLHAYAVFSAGDPAASERANALALDLADRTGDPWTTAAALALRAMHALIRGDLDTIARDGARAADLFAELGDRWGALQTVAPLAALAEIRGDYEEAARRQEEGLVIARELGLQAEISARLSGLGRLALLTHDWNRAHDLHTQALDLASAHGYRYGRIHAEMGLALGARRSGDLDAAEAHLTRIRDRHADVSSPAGDHLRQAELGFIAELRGDAAGAEAHHLLGLRTARALAEPRAVALSLEGLAGAAAVAGTPARAAELLGAADAARRSVGAPLPPAERGDVNRISAAARAALGESAYAEAFARGADLPPDRLPHA
ncbi:AfsR family transcriptional regulator [Streptomyces venezuelae]|uniref:AfsR family transcriptional regulator n=1 Tax=Streptomyces venezuelae TaxID=54571 RepID=A0A5P2C8W8_STRVZ|nr:AfsR family transcriptional regulator [Streptomyces venezuelae]